MIDFAKIRIINPDRDNLYNNPLLDFKQEVSVKTGEITGNMVAEYQGLKFIIYVSGVIIIQGSLHKYKNMGKHNHDDFNRLQIKEVINEILTKFNLDARNCALVNLEVGANVTPIIPAKEVIKYLFLHQRKEFKYGDFKNGTYKQSSYREYYIKCYDKAQQYGINKEILRIEIKLMTSRIINKYGIYTLEDLLKPACLIKLGTQLLKCWQDILMYDPSISKSNLPWNYRKKLEAWSNPMYWSSLAQDKSVYRNRLSREKKIYQTYQKYCSKNYQLQITKTIYEKLKALLSPAEYRGA